MKNKKTGKELAGQAALRAFLYQLILKGMLCGLLAVLVFKQYLVTVLSYQLILQVIVMMLLAIDGIALAVFLIGILIEIWGNKKEKRHGETV